MKRALALLGALSLVSAACGGDDSADTTITTTAPTTTAAQAPTGPAMSSAEVVFDAQTSDGSPPVIG